MIENLIKHHISGIPPKIWKLHPTSFKLYLLVLHTCASEPNGYCGASNVELSQIVGESIRTIGYHLKQLEMLEFIKIRRINQYVRQIEASDTDRIKKLIDKQKGSSEPNWMDEYLAELRKMDG